MRIITSDDFEGEDWAVKPCELRHGAVQVVIAGNGKQVVSLTLTVTEARALATRLRQVAADVAGQAKE